MRSDSIPTVSKIRSLTGTISWSRRLILLASGGILIFAPLAYGAVHPWAYYTVGLWVGFLTLALLIAGLHELVKRPTYSLVLPYPPLWWLGVGLALLIVTQVVFFPQGLVKWLSPSAWEIRAMGNGFALRDLIPFSLNPYGTVVEGLKLWPALGLFFILIYSINTNWQIKGMVGLILSVGLFEVLYGFWHFHSHLIWGWPNPYTGNRLSGTFINSNHLGMFLAMAILLGYGLFLALREDGPGIMNHSSGWDRVRHFSRAEYLDNQIRRFPLLVLLLVVAVGLIFTGSRGGMVSVVMGFGLMALLIWTQRWNKGHIFIIVVFMATAFLFSSLIGSNAILGRFQDVTDQGRYQALKACLAIFREYPILGSGLATFGDLFYRYEPANLKGTYFPYAHSDWLQLLAETGIIGFSLVAIAWVVFFAKLAQKWRQRRTTFARGIGLGGITALAAGVLHGLVEFPFHIPACSLLFASIAAIAYLAVSSHQHQEQRIEYFSYPIIKISGKRSKIAFLVVLGLVGIQLVIGLRVCYNWLGEAAAPSEFNNTRATPKSEMDDYRRALAFNLTNSKYYLGLAEALQKAGPADKPQAETEKSLKMAVFWSPANWGYRLKLAEFYLRHYKEAPVRQIPLALQEFAAAVELFPESAMLNFHFASVLCWAENYYPPLVPIKMREWRVPLLEKAVRLEPKLSKYLNNQ